MNSIESALLYLLFGVASGALVGWLGVSAWVRGALAAKRKTLADLSFRYGSLLHDVEQLRLEEKRVGAIDLLRESTRLSDEIDAMRQRLRQLGLYAGGTPPVHTGPVSGPLIPRKPPNDDDPRDSEWWREQP